MNSTQLQHKNFSVIPFGQYADKILQYANETFATIYYKHLKKYWHDGSFFAKMPHNYTITDWQSATFETYLPTREAAHGLNFFRITLKLIPEIDNETYHQEAENLHNQIQTPIGELDSELKIIISPRLKRFGFLHAFRHAGTKKGYLTTVYVTNSKGEQTPPEVLWVRILRSICTFLDKRLTEWLKALQLHPWETDHKDNNTLYYIQSISAVLGRFSHSLRTSLLSMSECLDVLLHKIWAIKEEIGNQSLALMAVKPLIGLHPDKLMGVFKYIRQEIESSLAKNPLELTLQEKKLLQVIRNG